MKNVLRILVAVAFVVTATTAFATETGSISGVVKDGTGAPVPGATVTVTGSQAPRNTVTGAGGMFKFPILLPGNYVVTAELKGLGTASHSVKVFVDNDAQVELVLIQTTKTEIVVTGAMSEIDKKASEVNFNYTDNVIKDLPRHADVSGADPDGAGSPHRPRAASATSPSPAGRGRTTSSSSTASTSRTRGTATSDPIRTSSTSPTSTSRRPASRPSSAGRWARCSTPSRSRGRTRSPEASSSTSPPPPSRRTR